MRVDALYTLCIERDLEIWKHTSVQILNNINAGEYNLVVPDNQVDLFKKATPEKFTVKSESEVNAGVSYSKINKLLPPLLKPYTGWYLQQIIKIEAIIKSKKDSVVIWDSDTIPLVKINFCNPDGSLNYYVSNEYNEEYFRTNVNLIGLEKQVDFSFISQCFPAYTKDVQRLIADIELKHQKIWYEAMLESLSGEVIQGFSEYEMMGSYLFKYAQGSMNFMTSKRWSRDGKKVFKTYAHLNKKQFQKQARHYDFIAIEGGLDESILNFYLNKIKNRLCVNL